MPNLFHRYEEQDNQDELYVVYLFHKWIGQWASLCPYNAGDQERVGDGAARRRSDGPPAVHLRLHGDRRRVEVRAELGLQAVGRDARPGSTTRRQRRAGRLEPETTAAQALLRICLSAPRRRGIARTAGATRRTARWSTCSTRGRSSGPTRSRIRSACRTTDSLWMMAQEYFISQDPSPPPGSSMKDFGVAADALPGAVAGRRVRATSRTSIAWSTITSRMAAGRARYQHAAPAGVLADVLQARREPSRGMRCPGTAAHARRRSARRCRNAVAPGPTPGLERDVRRAGGHRLSGRVACVAETARCGRAIFADRRQVRSIRSTCSGRKARCCAPTASADPDRR